MIIAAQTFSVLWQIIEPFVGMAIIALGWFIVGELKAHGYKAAYASAIVRGMGAGVMAAQAAGIDPFSARGRRIVASEGAKYIEDTVPEAAEHLDYDEAEHARRVVAQLGVVAATAQSLVPTIIPERAAVGP